MRAMMSDVMLMIGRIRQLSGDLRGREEGVEAMVMIEVIRRMFPMGSHSSS
jgi:hypothetical protein